MKRLLWGLGGVLVLLMVCSAVLLWRLSAGPLGINALTPYLEQALKTPLAGHPIDIQDTLLVWDKASHSLELRARNVTIRDPQGPVVATLPLVHVALSLRALLQRTLAPTSVQVEGLQLILTRGSDGALQVGIADASAPPPTSRQHLRHDATRVWQGVADTLDRLTTSAAPDQPLSYLRGVRVTRSALTLHDQVAGVTWQLPMVDIDVTRRGERLAGRLQATVTLPNASPTLHATLAYERATQRVSMKIDFAHLRPADLAERIPLLHPLTGVELPLSGTIELALHPSGRLQTLSVALSGGAGRLSHARVQLAPRAISGLTLRGTVNLVNGTARLDQAVLTMPPAGTASPTLTIKGMAEGLGADLKIAADVSLKALPIDDLKAYWPADVLANARAWLVENLAAGMVDQADAHLAMTFPKGNGRRAQLDRLKGAIRYHGMDVHYLRPVPALTAVTGTAQFDQQGFHIKVDSGTGAGLNLTSGTVEISGLDVGQDAIAIRVGLEAPLPAILALLDHPRLNLLSTVDIDPVGSQGQAIAELTLAFSLLGKVQLSDIMIRSRGTLNNVALPNLLPGQNLQQGSLAFSLDEQQMTVTGNASLAGVPLTFIWQEAFTVDADWRTVIDAEIPQLTPADLATLGADVQDFVSGPLPATVKVAMGHNGKKSIQITANLQESDLRLPVLDWHKPPGQAGTLHGTLTLEAGQAIGHSSFAIETETLATQGTARLDLSQKTLHTLDLHPVRFGDSHLHRVTLRQQDDGFAITLGEGVLDARPFLAAWQRAKEANRQPPTLPPLIRLDAPALQRVSFGPDRAVQNVAIHGVYRQGTWERIGLSGQLPTASTVATEPTSPTTTTRDAGLASFSVAYQPSPSGPYHLTVQADDLGATLQALRLDDRLTHGRLKLTGQTREPRPDSRLDTTLDLRNFTLKRAPLLGRLLAAMSFGGLNDLLNGSGLNFARLSGDVSLEHGVITVDHLRAHGGALGLTAEGTIHIATGDVNLKGTVVPVQGLNTLPGKIPLIGKLLVGGKGEGLIAVGYRVKGTLGEPQIAVNPATALTPGFLRGIFDLFETGEDPKID